MQRFLERIKVNNEKYQKKIEILKYKIQELENELKEKDEIIKNLKSQEEIPELEELSDEDYHEEPEDDNEENDEEEEEQDDEENEEEEEQDDEENEEEEEQDDEEEEPEERAIRAYELFCMSDPLCEYFMFGPWNKNEDDIFVVLKRIKPGPDTVNRDITSNTSNSYLIVKPNNSVYIGSYAKTTIEVNGKKYKTRFLGNLD